MSDSVDLTEVEAEAPAGETEAPAGETEAPAAAPEVPEAPAEEAEAPAEPAPLVSPADPTNTHTKNVRRCPTRRPESGAHRQRSCRIHWVLDKLSWTPCASRPS